MIRLAIPGIHELTRQEIGRRLHRAQVQEEHEESDIVAILSPPDAKLALDASRDPADPRSPCRPILFVPSALTDQRQWQACLSAMDSKPVRIANPLRYAPAVQTIRAQVEAGIQGRPGILRLHHWQSSEPTDLLPWQTTAWPIEWLCDLDMMMWLMNGTPDRVFALQQREKTSPDAERSAVGTTAAGTVQLHCTWNTGGMALIDFSDQLPAGEGYRSMMLIGSSGAAYVDDQQDRQLIFRGGAPQTILDQSPILSLTSMLQDFVDSCIDSVTGKVPMANAVNANAVNAVNTANDRHSAGDWPNVLRLVEIAQRSLDTGLAVEWKDS